jgi:hypothetical protein
MQSKRKSTKTKAPKTPRGPAVETAEPEFQYLDLPQLEKIAEGFAWNLGEYDQKAITPLVGFLEYLAAVANNTKIGEPFGNVDDIVAAVNRHIFGKVCHGDSRKFEKQAFRRLMKLASEAV